jgi:hypothetical protein
MKKMFSIWNVHLWDQTNLTEKIRGIFSVGNQRNTVGFVGIIFQHPTLDKLRFFSTHFVWSKIMLYGMLTNV